MATRSMIGIKYNDDNCEAIYCHWDGNFHNVGYHLHHYYKNIEKIKNLIALGDICSLHQEIDSDDPKLRTFAFCRDKHEDYRPPTKFKLEEFHDLLNSCDCEFGYLWDVQKGDWYMYRVNDSYSVYSKEYQFE